MLQTVEVFARTNGSIVIYALVDDKPKWASIYEPSISCLRYACNDLDLLLKRANLATDCYWKSNLYVDTYFAEPGKRLGTAVKSIEC